HVLQDPAVAVVVRLAGSVDTHDTVELGDGAVVVGGGDPHRLRDRIRRGVVESGDAGDVVGLGTVESQRAGALLVGELQRQHAHPDQVGAVDPFERLGDHRLYTEQHGALGGPVTRRAGAVLLAAEYDQWGPGGPVVLRGIVDERLGTALLGEVARVTALYAVQQFVAQPDVG